MSLRGQLRAMTEFRHIAFSDMLVDQVEEEFHATHKNEAGVKTTAENM